ncbi:unnamed protein product [Paramecium sonneborni]|uniref:Uncharacterized protein n=1 Tax=Paramecium sonneborni TaxID=65129 RepID=A0A8S1RKQ6_9CILI|nr:unnamed protein product [Paramecium sonneborni]
MQSPNPAQAQLQQQLEILQKGFEQLVQRVPETIHLSCLSQNNKDVNRYSDCMMKRSKRVDKEMRLFDFKMVFMGNQFERCIQSGDTDKCVESAKTDVQRYINEFQKNIN